MAKQQLKDILIYLTMIITVASAVFSVGYNYRIVKDSSDHIKRLEEEKLDYDVYISKHEALKESINQKMDTNISDHKQIKDDLQKIGTKVEDIQRKVDKMSQSKVNQEIVPALARTK